MAQSPVPPEFDVALVAVPTGKMTAVWWEWLQRYIKWDEACCEAGGGGGSSGVSDITGTPPVVVTGTSLLAAPEALAAGAVTISMPPATGSQNGYLTSANWTTFNGKEAPIAAGTTSQWWRGDKSWQTLPATAWGSLTGVPATFPPTLPIAQSGVTNLGSDLALKAPLASPVFTGDPQAPTPPVGDSDTSIATTAFVQDTVDNGIGTIGLLGYFDYTFNPSNYTPPPIAGNFRMNNANQTLATHIYINEQTAPANDAALMLAQIAVGDKLLMQRKSDATKWRRYIITAISDAGTYWDFTVTYVDGGSALDNARTAIIVQKATGGSGGLADGDKGDIVVSGTGATWMFDTAVVTAAAKTVLDDTTTGAMLITLGAAPKPQSAAGVGQWMQFISTSGVALVLPSGGTWAYMYVGYTSAGVFHSQGITANVAAGGTTVSSAVAGIIWSGLCWRIA